MLYRALSILSILALSLIWVPAASADSRDSAYPDTSRWKVADGFSFGSARLEEPNIKVSYANKIITIDASVVVPGDLGLIWDTCIDYEAYPKIGMPNVVQNVIVERAATGDELVFWTHMNNAGRPSKHYMQVHFEKPRGGITWTRIPKREEWGFEEKTAFAALVGSIYLEKSSTDRVYIRYYLQGTLDHPWPDFLVSSYISNVIEKGVREILSILARRGQIRQ